MIELWRGMWASYFNLETLPLFQGNRKGHLHVLCTGITCFRAPRQNNPPPQYLNKNNLYYMGGIKRTRSSFTIAPPIFPPNQGKNSFNVLLCPPSSPCLLLSFIQGLAICTGPVQADTNPCETSTATALKVHPCLELQPSLQSKRHLKRCLIGDHPCLQVHTSNLASR